MKQAALEELRQFRAVTAGEPGLAGLSVQNKNKEEVSTALGSTVAEQLATCSRFSFRSHGLNFM